MSGFTKRGLERMRSVLDRHVAEGSTPGLVAVVSRRGETRLEALGTTEPHGAGRPIARDTLFRIASMSKPVTAAAALILAEEGAIRLDEPVDRLLPELAGRRVLRRPDGPLEDTVPARRPVLVRDLLTFTLGWGIVMAPPGTLPLQRAMEERELGQGAPQPALPPGPDEWLRRLGELPLMHQPGERWLYNTGSDVLGVLISRASGLPLEAFLRQRLFDPLGMADTGFSVPAQKLDRFLPGYGTDPATGGQVCYDPGAGGQWAAPPAFPSGGGGLVSTADDYLAFARMLLDGGRCGGERILSRAAVAAMTADQLTAEQKAVSGLQPDFFERHGWGFGVCVTTRRYGIAAAPGQYGWDGGLGTVWRNSPEDELVTILLTNRAWSSPEPPPVASDFLTTAYAALDD